MRSSMTISQLLAVAALACGLCIPAANSATAQSYASARAVVVKSERGGDLVNYARRVSRIRRSNVPVRITGSCQSACTLFLALPTTQTCITPGASFGFHRAYGSTQNANAWGTDYLLRKYPYWVQAWIARQGGLSTRIKRMNYSYASRYMQRCNVG